MWYPDRNHGFGAFLWFTPADGNGIVLLINANENGGNVNTIARAIAANDEMAGFPFP